MLMETPVMRVVDRKLLPSTRAEMMAVRFAVLSLFIPPTIIDRSIIVKKKLQFESRNHPLRSASVAVHNGDVAFRRLYR